MDYETVGEAFRLPLFEPRKRWDGKPVPYGNYPAASSIFSMKMP